MKHKLGLIILGAMLAVATVQAQTNAVPDTNAPAAGIGSDLKKLFEDDAAFFGTNTDITLDAGGIYSDHKFGGLLDFHTPLPIGTNGQVAAGISSVYIDHSLYSATLNLKAGTTTTIPWINLPINLWAETGPGYDFKTKQVIAQSFAGGTFGFDLFSGHKLYISGMTGNISDRPGIVYGGMLSYSIKF